MLLGKQRFHPVDSRRHACCTTEITVNDDPVFGGDFRDRRGEPFEERMAVADVARQHAAPGTGADRLLMHQH